MNTPAHLVVNLALLERGAGRGHGAAIAVGALLPDLPMFGFYAWERLVLGTPELSIWREVYFQPDWQLLFDAFNSLPLAALGALLGLATRNRSLVFVCVSMVLHDAIDLALHHEDAHRHFLPFTDWRFRSPVSYWNPAHHGALGALLETGAVLVGSAALWRRHPGVPVRVALAAVCLLSVGAYTGLYVYRVLG